MTLEEIITLYDHAKKELAKVTSPDFARKNAQQIFHFYHYTDEENLKKYMDKIFCMTECYFRKNLS